MILGANSIGMYLAILPLVNVFFSYAILCPYLNILNYLSSINRLCTCHQFLKHKIFIYRLSLSSDNYQVINTPTNIGNGKPYLGRLDKEVCFGIVHEGQLQVWTLKESYGKIEWALRYQNDLNCYSPYPYLASLYNHAGLKVGLWIVKEHNISVHNSNHIAETLSEEGRVGL